MDYKHQRKVSLLEVEEFFFNKVLSRDSSVGCSSHKLYYRSNSEGGVPFKWEMQPGTPKEPPKEDIIPAPLSPPPAVLSLGWLPKPCNDIEEPPKKASILKSKLMFWRQSKKSQLGVNKKVSKESDINFLNMKIYSSDGENFIGSPRKSSSTSSSNSLQSSSRVKSPVKKEKIDALFYGGCSPWHVTSVLVRVGRRI